MGVAGVTWLKDAGRPVRRLRCDVCGRRGISGHDLYARVPVGWAATRVKSRHLCPRCARAVRGLISK